MTITPTEFWDREAIPYSKKPIGDVQSYARKLTATQALMRPDMRVLEFGCGTGSTAIEHAPHVAHIDATDVSAQMIAIGRQRAADAGITNARFAQASIEEFEAAERYDMVLALNVLHLLPDRRAALAKIHSLLKPGGVFVSSTVCLAEKLWILRPVIPVMQWIGKAPYVSFVNEAQVQQELATAGFDAQEQFTHGRAHSLFMIASVTEASVADHD